MNDGWNLFLAFFAAFASGFVLTFGIGIAFLVVVHYVAKWKGW